MEGSRDDGDYDDDDGERWDEQALAFSRNTVASISKFLLFGFSLLQTRSIWRVNLWMMS